MSFAGVNLRAIVPWITLQWQHQQLYGKAYLCKAAVIRIARGRGGVKKGHD
ncbi:hypothetical protein SeGA_2001, partial [Salmonella enterica subsp. enterica serovar Gaminara str. A4-567]